MNLSRDSSGKLTPLKTKTITVNSISLNPNYKYLVSSPNSIGNEISDTKSNFVVKKILLSPSQQTIPPSLSNQIIRKDLQGTPILKGKKKHKVSFVDAVEGRSLVNCSRIQSYKAFNAGNTFNEKVRLCEEEKHKVISTCCILF
jgi:hypothetical protein